MEYICLTCNTIFQYEGCSSSVKCVNNHRGNILTTIGFNQLNKGVSNTGTPCLLCIKREVITIKSNGNKVTFEKCNVINENINNIKVCPNGLWIKE